MNNLFAPVSEHQRDQEQFAPIVRGPAGLLVERIVSWGHTTPEGTWYDQAHDEWVVVLEGSARLGYEDGSERVLHSGEHLLIPRHVRHRVVFTSTPCIWLAVHAPELVPCNA